jgi:Mechanosensitive ion channel
MSTISRILRPAVVALLMMLGLLAYGRPGDQRKQSDGSLPRRRQVIGFLTRSIEWYRSSSFEREIPIQSTDVPLRENAQAVRTQILRLSFDYAKALAADQARSSISPDQQSDASAPDSSRSDLQHWMKIEAQCEAEAQEARKDVASIRSDVEAHRGKDRTKLEVALSEGESHVDLVQAKCQSYGNLLDFVRTMSASNPQNEDLVSIIDALSRTVPELGTAVGSTPPSQGGFSSVVPPATGASIPHLIFDVVLSRRRLRTLDRADQTTDSLAQASQDLRNPLAEYLYSALQNANLSSSDLRRSDIEALRRQQVRLDQLSAEVTALAPAIVALDKQKILFGIYMSDLASWRTLAVSQYTAAWKRLIIHVVAIVGVVILLVIFGAALRRATLRYVHDENRRRAILIAERIVLWVCIFFVVVLTFASNLGSLATCLGLITAGLAVALQNVILAVLGYTVLVGKLGLRLGDQVQVSGVTGKVVEFGLLQFQVREIDAQGQPTGRLGSFSNSFIFVSPATGIFKLGIEKSNTESSDEPSGVGPHDIVSDPTTANA